MKMFNLRLALIYKEGICECICKFACVYQYEPSLLHICAKCFCNFQFVSISSFFQEFTTIFLFHVGRIFHGIYKHKERAKEQTIFVFISSRLAVGIHFVWARLIFMLLWWCRRQTKSDAQRSETLARLSFFSKNVRLA